MVKLRALLLPLISIALLSLSACHTAVWQDVEGNVEGTWTLMPVDTGLQIQFQFSNGLLTITDNGIPLEFHPEGQGANTSTTIEYDVIKQANNHYIHTPRLVIKNFGWRSYMFMNTERWLVITSKEKELYLESIGYEGLKGTFQLHFFR